MWGWKTAAAVAVGLTVLIGTAAYAAIPDSSGAISGCYAKSNGVLRVIDAEAGGSCVANKELPLSWNQQGPPGPPGPASLVTREVVNSSAPFGTQDGFDMEVARAECGPGEFVTGGGHEIIGAQRAVIAQVTVRDSFASGPVLGGPPFPTHWLVVGIAPTGIGDWGVTARAICATPPPPLP